MDELHCLGTADLEAPCWIWPPAARFGPDAVAALGLDVGATWMRMDGSVRRRCGCGELSMGIWWQREYGIQRQLAVMGRGRGCRRPAR